MTYACEHSAVDVATGNGRKQLRAAAVQRDGNPPFTCSRREQRGDDAVLSFEIAELEFLQIPLNPLANQVSVTCETVGR